MDNSELIAAVANRLFGASSIRTDGLESMANAALQRGIDAFMNKNYAKAVDEFKRSVGIGRNGAYAADAAQYMAMSYLQMDQPEEAVKAYQTALEIDRYRDDLRVKLGNLYFSQEKYEDARTQYAEAVRLNPSTVNRYSLGQAYIELGRYDDAEAQYAEIQRISPEQAGGYLGMGLTYSRNGKHEDALQQFDQAIARDPGLFDAYAQKGYTYADMGDMENAQKMVDHLERVDQADTADTLSRYMYKVDPPKMLFGMSTSSFQFSMGKGTPLVALNSYLATRGSLENPHDDDPVRQEHGPGFDRERRQLADQPRDRRGAGRILQLRHPHPRDRGADRRDPGIGRLGRGQPDGDGLLQDPAELERQRDDRPRPHRVPLLRQGHLRPEHGPQGRPVHRVQGSRLIPCRS